MNINKILLILIVMGSLSLLVSAYEPDKPVSPFESVDTSSPRRTLMGFLETMNKRYRIGMGPEGSLTEYLASDRLYPSKAEELAVKEMFKLRGYEFKYLDLSGVADAAKSESLWRLSLQLKEVLDRIHLPDLQEIPDEAMMKALGQSHWRIPGTQIDITRKDKGPHEGEYLFSAETVNRLPAFYEAIKNLPYQPGASEGWYFIAFHEPMGLATLLRHIVPPRWIMNTPKWTNTLIADQPIWRWVSILIVLFVFWTVLGWSRSLTRYLQKGTSVHDSFWGILPLVVLVGITPIYSWFFSEILRVSGFVYRNAWKTSPFRAGMDSADTIVS